MIYILLCIFSTTGIMVVFKIAGRLRLDTFTLIVINYFTASLLGFMIGGLPRLDMIESGWLIMAVIIGILFIVMFFVIALSTQKAGIAITSVASKMSVVIPISFSLFYFHEAIGFLKITGIILALFSVFMTTYKPVKKGKNGIELIALPLTLFLGAGLIDSLIKYSQELYIGDSDTIMFSSVLFSISALTGLVISFFRKRRPLRKKTATVVLAGIILGIVNLGSLYGIIMALESNIFDSSIVFGINNIGIVVLSVLIAVFFFSERLSRLNKAGIALAIITIIFLSFL